MKMFDTHAHLNFSAFKHDADKIIKLSLNEGLGMIVVGAEYKTSQRAIEISEKHPKDPVYAAIGLHPAHLEKGEVNEAPKGPQLEFKTAGEVFDKEKYKNLFLSSKKIAAIGEIGLDYMILPKKKPDRKRTKELQKEILKQQLALAKELRLPVIFHCRLAHKGLIEILESHPELKPKKAVAHGFVGNLKELQGYLSLGFYIGFNGIIFKKINGIDFEALIQNTPLERILLETDCPYLAPPQAGKKRNEPLFLKYIAERIAQIKKISLPEFLEITLLNAKNFFQI